jgi:ABC-2 type transport system ATP-binding protein
VEFGGVTKRYGSTVALDAINLEIPLGATVALLGPNGAGKSTAISLMLDLLHPDGGTVRVLGLDPADAIASGRVGAMLQTGGLPTGVTVAEIIAFARRLYPHPIAFAEILDTAGLTALAGRRGEALSGGETQRLRFGLAIAGDPDLLFLDEPTVAMDVESRRAFWADMRQFADQGRTVLFATHYLEEADQVADRVVVLDHGHVVADGTSGSIKASVQTKTVRFTLAGADRAALGALAGVRDVAIRGAAVTLTTDDADATTRAIYKADLPVRDLEVTGAALEDAFVALTSGN